MSNNKNSTDDLFENDSGQEEIYDNEPPADLEQSDNNDELFNALNEIESQGETSEKEKDSVSMGFSAFIYDCYASLLSAIVIVCLMFTFLFRLVCVDGHSMDNTLHHGQWLIVSSLFYEPQRGDIIVVSRESSSEKPIIKRIIALAGDTININFETHQVIVNGIVLEEPYIAAPTAEKGNVTFPMTVPDGCVFVMGDNRNDSLDSRFARIGNISVERLLGKTVFSMNPFGKMTEHHF